MRKARSRMLKKVCLCFALGMMIFSSTVVAQSDEKVLDPAGYVTKYNPDFKGIGPRVYVLPAPRSKQEVLVDSYDEKKGFYDSIVNKLDYLTLIEEYRATSNQGYLKQNFTPYPQTEAKWSDMILKLKQNNNTLLATGLQNEHALELLKSKNVDGGISALADALAVIQKTDFRNDAAVIKFNLASAYLYKGRYQDAGALAEQSLQQAIDNKNQNEQANILIKVALIKAYQKEYKAAENTIIRRAIPLLNKTKNLEGKIKALIDLAKIYQLQNKHTEAQWFLIQAKEIAESRHIKPDLPEIEYMLGYSKFIQQNYKVAQIELENAKTLAENENNKVLQLAIYDKLGEIDLIMEDYEGAEKNLSEYWRLRNELF